MLSKGPTKQEKFFRLAVLIVGIVLIGFLIGMLLRQQTQEAELRSQLRAGEAGVGVLNDEIEILRSELDRLERTVATDGAARLISELEYQLRRQTLGRQYLETYVRYAEDVAVIHGFLPDVRFTRLFAGPVRYEVPRLFIPEGRTTAEVIDPMELYPELGLVSGEPIQYEVRLEGEAMETFLELGIVPEVRHYLIDVDLSEASMSLKQTHCEETRLQEVLGALMHSQLEGRPVCELLTLQREAVLDSGGTVQLYTYAEPYLFSVDDVPAARRQVIMTYVGKGGNHDPASVSVTSFWIHGQADTPLEPPQLAELDAAVERMIQSVQF